MFKLHILVLTLHASKIMLKILQARTQQYMNYEFPDVQSGFKKQRNQRSNYEHSRIIEKAREFQKNIYLCFIDNAKAFDCVDHNKLWKILQEMGILHHLTCLLRNLYAGQEATVRTGHGKTDCFQIGKGVRQGVYCHPAYLTYMQSTSWETLGWKKHMLEWKFSGEISITSDMQMHHPYGRKWRGTKNPPDKSERGEWKSWLKAQHSENEDHAILSHHSREIDGETVADYIFVLQNHCRWWLQLCN